MSDQAVSAPCPLVSPEAEARAFWRMRFRMAATMFGQMLAGARLRLSLIVVLSGLLWGALFWLSADAFRFLDTILPADLNEMTVQAVFSTFFGALMVMLVFSSGIILYSAAFRARDVPLLLTLPGRPERIFLTKFQDAVVMSSWAFLLLGSPMLLAYGIVAGAPWYYFAMLLPFLVAFVYIPAALGALVCLTIVCWLPAGRWFFVVLAVVLLMAAVGMLVWWTATAQESNMLTAGWFQELLSRLKVTENRLAPNWWLSIGLLEAARRNWAEAVLFLALMISNALFVRQLAVAAAARLYRPAYARLHGRSGWRPHFRLDWIDRAMFRTTAFLPLPMRLLMVNDLRLFRRDALQWSQLLIFAGLLIVYFVNVRGFNYDLSYFRWVSVVSFMNLAVVGLLLSTFTTRFIFPMISLEGRRFWILGLLPLKREMIVWSKFLFGVILSIVPSSLLVLLSDLMLRVDPLIVASHQLTCILLCMGLSGIAVGLGAKMPNLREQSPSRIAAGFGGTLNLVLSTLYIIAIVLMTAVPSHFYLGAENSPMSQYYAGPSRFAAWIEFWLLAGTLASVALGIVATVVPLVIGFRAFRRTEF